MDLAHLRKLYLSEFAGYVQILDTKGIAFTNPYSDKEMATMPIQDLKALVTHVRDLSRTPTGNQ